MKTDGSLISLLQFCLCCLPEHWHFVRIPIGTGYKHSVRSLQHKKEKENSLCITKSEAHSLYFFNYRYYDYYFVCRRLAKQKLTASLSPCASRCSVRWSHRPWMPWTSPVASEPGVIATCEPFRPATPKTMTASRL